MARRKRGKRKAAAPSPYKRLKPPASVKTKSAEKLFERVAIEALHGHRELIDDLTHVERETVIQWLSEVLTTEKIDNIVHDVLWEIDYRWKPVDIEEFVRNDYYAGKVFRDANGEFALYKPWMVDLKEVFKPGSNVVEWLMTGSIGIGKGHPVGEVVATPDGWRPVGELSVGDSVLGSDGSATKVTGVYPRGELSVYRVTFTDYTSVLVDGDHLWAVKSPSDKYSGKDWRVKATKDLIDDVKNSRGQRKWHVPVMSAPAEYPKIELPLAPYTLGALLGDGCITDGTPRISTTDQDILSRVQEETGLGATYVDGCDYRLSDGKLGGELNPLTGALRELGVWGTHSYEKFVPKLYMTADTESRLAVLRGLLDTDGWYIEKLRHTAFSSSSRRLAEDVAELVRSLGGVARLKAPKKTKGRDAHYVTLNMPMNPFWVGRKADAWTPHEKYAQVRMIDSIEPEGVDEVVCISVEADDSLYVAKDYVVTHNTAIAMAAMLYKVYCLSCLRNPAAFYSLMPGSLIVFGLFSPTKRLVADTGYFKLKGMVDVCPYFREKYPRSPKIDSQIDFGPTTGQNVKIISGSQGFHGLGQDVFSFAVDEVNFMREKREVDTNQLAGQAQEIYNTISTRLRSRFMREGGTLPGIMLLMSSRNSQTSFLEDRLRVAKNDSTVFVSDYALWDVHPEHRYSKKRFVVEVGDRLQQSRILKPDEYPRPGAKTVDVPEDFRKQFEEATDQALRDIAGVATFNLSPFFRDRKSVIDAARDRLIHPFTRSQFVVDYLDDVMISEYFDIKAACRKVESKWVPRLNPAAMRFIHADLAITNDCVGLSMGHVSGMVRHKRVDEFGVEEEKIDPFIIIDFMLRIVPPSGSEIDFSKIRSFVLYLRRCGYKIKSVTFDEYQSRDSQQILEKQGFETATVSMDRQDNQYKIMRSTFFDRRIGMYHYDPFLIEVLDLEYDSTAHKVDHPIKASDGNNGLNGKGSKDVSDAVCGVVWACSQEEAAHAYVPIYDRLEGDEPMSVKVIDPTDSIIAANEEKKAVFKRIGGRMVDMRKLRESVDV